MNTVEPLQGVVITSREIYDAVVRLTGRVDVLIENQGRLTEDLKDHEGRLRRLEATRWPLPALAIVISMATAGLSVADKIFG